MSDKKAISNRAKATLLVLSTAFILIILSLFFNSSAENELKIKQEINNIYRIAGKETTDRILELTTILYTRTMVDTNIESAIDHNFIADKQDYKAKVVWEKVNNKIKTIMQNLKIAVFQICLRIAVLKEWFLTLFALICGFISDGYYKRKISQYEIGAPSTGMSRLWWLLMGASSILLVVYVLFPVSIGVATFYFPLIYILILCICCKYVFSSYHKNF